MFRRLLVRLDGTPDSELAIPLASYIARSLRSEIRLVDVPPSPPEENATRRAFRYLDRIARQFVLTDLPRDLVDHDSGQAIVEASQQLGADVVVMGSHEFVERFPLSFLDTAAVPVLLVADAPVLVPSDKPVRPLAHERHCVASNPVEAY
jgi:nucleotide-binding universal stress UspA family protein